MSKEKQIEEMAKTICKHYNTEKCTKCGEYPYCSVGLSAEALYNAGYRKQIEGEWIFKQTHYEADECNCSICGQLMTTAKGVRMNYCPNCGAKMKGGE